MRAPRLRRPQGLAGSREDENVPHSVERITARVPHWGAGIPFLVKQCKKFSVVAGIVVGQQLRDQDVTPSSGDPRAMLI
jgi:hypothetical protein